MITEEYPTPFISVGNLSLETGKNKASALECEHSIERPALDSECTRSMKRFKLNSQIVCHSEELILGRIMCSLRKLTEHAKNFTAGGRPQPRGRVPSLKRS